MRMLAIIGKATPNNQTGEIEWYLTDFRQMLHRQERFVYAWSFNPDDAAVTYIRRSLDRHDDVFLYLPGEHRRSSLRMHIVDFHYDRSAEGTPCPLDWAQYCIKDLRGLRSFNAHEPIHMWFLIDVIDDLPQPVDLLTTFRPVFRDKYREWGRNFFAFRQA